MTAIGHSKDGVGSSHMDTIVNYDLYYRNVLKFIDRGDGWTAVCRQFLDYHKNKKGQKLCRKMSLKDCHFVPKGNGTILVTHQSSKDGTRGVPTVA